MTRKIREAQIDVLKPHSTAPVADFIIPDSDIETVAWSERAGKPLDTGSIVLDNADGKYTTDNYGTKVGVHDKLEFKVSWEGDGTGLDFGDQPFGEGTFGGDPVRHVGTLAVSNWHASGWAWNSTLELDVETFVFNRLNARQVRASFDATQLSGTTDSVLNTILRKFVPDVNRDLLPEITETIDFYSDGKRANKVVDELAIRARVATGEAYVTGARDSSLLFRSLADMDPVGTFTSGTSSPDLKGIPSQSSAADDLVNEMRVEGGIDDENNIDEEQLTEDQWTTVTESSRVTYQLSPSKPEITKVHVKVQHVTGSEDDLRVRLHPDQAGSPRNPGDTDLDYANGRVELESGEEGERILRLGNHVLGPNDTPWLLIEASGSDGVNVRTDSATGDPWFQTNFAKPIIVEIPDEISQNDYRIVEDTMDNSNIQSFNAARDRARAELRRRGLPRLRFGPMTAESARAHELRVGEAVVFPFDWLRADGKYICTQVSHSYEQSTLETDLEFMGFERYA